MDDTDPGITPLYPGAPPQDAPERPGTRAPAAPPYADAQAPAAPPYPGAPPPYPGAQQPGGPYPGAQQPGGAHAGAQPPAPPYPGAQRQPPVPHYPGAQSPAAPYPGARQPGGAYGGIPQRSAVPPYPGAQPQSPAPPYPGAQPPGSAYRGAQPSPPAYPGAQTPAGAYPGAPLYPYPGQMPTGYPGQMPTGYPGQMPTGYPGQYPNAPGYYPPTPARKGRRRLIIGVVVGAVVMVAAAATAVVLLLPKNVSATTMALKSGQAVASSDGLTLTGTIAGGNANVSVTRAGTVAGTYSQNGNQVSRITIQGVTYLRAPAAFWRSTSVSATSATQAGGHWARAPADAVNMSFDSLTPAQVSRVLEHVGKNPRALKTTVNGTQVIRLSVTGTTYYISTASPYRLIRIDGVSGTRRYSFDVTELGAAAIGPVFASLHDDAQALQGAVDPQAIVLPLEKIKFGSNCNAATSCTVSSKVSVTAANSPRVIIVTMTVDFSSKEGGTPFATCMERTSATSSATVSESCGVGGSVWSGWFNSHTGNFTTWAHAHFEVTVNSASDIAALQSELNQEQHAR